MKKQRKKIDWRDIVLTILILALIILSVSCWHLYFYRALPYVECKERITAAQPMPEMSRTEIIETINELTNTDYEIVWVTDYTYNGYVSGDPFDNRIFINKTIRNNDLVWTYAHELTHKIKHSANEMFVEFETFKLLYESENTYFKDVALWQASIMYKYDPESDCTYYIINYLKKGDK